MYSQSIKRLLFYVLSFLINPMLLMTAAGCREIDIEFETRGDENPYSLVSNYFIRTFVERTRNMSDKQLKKEQGKLNAIKKAYQLTEFTFVPFGVVEINKGYNPYFPNVEYKGMLYSSTKEIGTSVPNAIPFYTFVTALRNPRSKLYTEYINEPPYHGTNCRAYYGTVCSSLVSYALGLNPVLGSYDFVDSDLMEDVEYKVPEDIEVGDVLWIKSHVAIITDIQNNAEDEVLMIEVSEAIHTGSRRRQYTRGAFDEIMHNKFEKVVRYKYIETNTEYEAFPEIVPVLNEMPVQPSYNEDLCVDKGDRSNYLEGEDVTINVFSPYDSVVVYKNRERYACFTEGNVFGDVLLSDLPYGTYSACLWSNNNQSKETSWIVVDYDVSYNKGMQVILFGSKNAIPTTVRLCSQSGSRGVPHNKLLYRLITGAERSAGYLDVPADRYYDDDHSFVQVKFKTDFGTVTTLPLRPSE